jgi:hypothetical protein
VKRVSEKCIINGWGLQSGGGDAKGREAIWVDKELR